MSLRRKFIFLMVAFAAINVVYLRSSFLYRIASYNDRPKYPVHDSGIFEEVFQYPDVFLRNYAQMEDDFKIFVYPNKDEEISYFNQRRIHGMLSSEMFFHYNLLSSDRFRASDHSKAHLFFIPLTWFQILGKGVYANGEDYIRYIIDEYPHWNRSTGVDHFFVTCHDDGARLSEKAPLNHSITVLCCAHYEHKHGVHHKRHHHHITLPQIRLPFARAGGNDIHNRFNNLGLLGKSFRIMTRCGAGRQHSLSGLGEQVHGTMTQTERNSKHPSTAFATDHT
ncbi:probable glycosyltransferase At5g03795 [Tripterygium wilfordii]|uniref:probable glycosyltransferase At5g03795 n=1 Tax=Tripterygium wilfordii TaxID=458696 RepID=UPI0018F848FA|nr:probable glycosyltransferase At5g03795 [Tripterygium wilfordii]